MKKYKVRYYFDGTGDVIIEAKNKRDAENKFYEGEFSDENEWGENYAVDLVEEN